MHCKHLWSFRTFCPSEWLTVSPSSSCSARISLFPLRTWSSSSLTARATPSWLSKCRWLAALCQIASQALYDPRPERKLGHQNLYEFIWKALDWKIILRKPVGRQYWIPQASILFDKSIKICSLTGCFVLKYKNSTSNFKVTFKGCCTPRRTKQCKPGVFLKISENSLQSRPFIFGLCPLVKKSWEGKGNKPLLNKNFIDVGSYPCQSASFNERRNERKSRVIFLWTIKIYNGSQQQLKAL